MVNKEAWKRLSDECAAKGVTLVAVSKRKPVEDIKGFYDLGQRDFGENYVQELVSKAEALPADIKWHFIGHLQSNKVKYIAPFVHLIHGVDSFGLLAEVNKQAEKCNRTIDVLLQLYIAEEETKFGLSQAEVLSLLDEYQSNKNTLQHIRICGLMGMATNTDNKDVVRREFAGLLSFLDLLCTTRFRDQPWFKICSMGMSADYEAAISEGSTHIRVGSLLFGERQY